MFYYLSALAIVNSAFDLNPFLLFYSDNSHVIFFKFIYFT